MKIETKMFIYLGIFFIPVATAYGLITHWHEPLGFLALYLTSGMCFMIGAYLWATGRRIDPRPEDDAYGEIDQGAGEMGFFPPYSWWPMPLAFGGALMFAGLAAGWWLFFIGLPILVISVVGWVFEYYRGAWAH